MQKGFTLIEVMIAIVIVAILVAIAIPSYRNYIVRTKRVDAQTQLIDIAHQLQRYKIANFTYTKTGGVPITLADIGRSSNINNSGQSLYTLQLTDVTANTWTLIANPVNNSSQVNDGSIYLNSRGQKCWEKGASSCTLSEESTWNQK